MSKYGSKTRVTEAVSLSGQRNAGAVPSVPNVYEQAFTSPGTWPWPGNVSSVEVLLVGGGQSGTLWFAPSALTQRVGGSGGGVGVFVVPVAAPVSVTVGAGGAPIPTTGAVAGVTQGNPGGTTSFGSYSVGGGDGKLITPSGTSLATAYFNQPGLSPGSANSIFGGSITTSTVPGARYGGGGAGGTGFNTGSAPTGSALGGRSKFGFGAGANGTPSLNAGNDNHWHTWSQGIPQAPPLTAATSGRANTGEGGGANDGPTPLASGGGGSGYVLVRWYEA